MNNFTLIPPSVFFCHTKAHFIFHLFLTCLFVESSLFSRGSDMPAFSWMTWTTLLAVIAGTHLEGMESWIHPVAISHSQVFQFYRQIVRPGCRKSNLGYRNQQVPYLFLFIITDLDLQPLNICHLESKKCLAIQKPVYDFLFNFFKHYLSIS